jgi:hypothetical protein
MTVLLRDLSRNSRAAVTACFSAGSLHRTRGQWLGRAGAAPIFGITVATLKRDGVLTETYLADSGVVRLTELGHKLAQLIRDEEAYATRHRREAAAEAPA